MKTDRRHELQTNVLADWLGKHLQQWQAHSKTILAVILLVVAGAIAGTFLVQDQAKRAQVGWNKLFQAFGERDPQALNSVAVANPGTTAGAWAALAEGDLKLAEGIGDLYTNRDNAKDSFSAAERSYLAVDQAGTDPMLRQRAWFGLGQVYESQGEVGKAKEAYGRLVSSAPTSALGKEAQSRVESLNSESTEKWYNWFANQTPRPPAVPGMPDGLGLPNLPSDLENLSDRPDLSMPNFPPLGTGSEATPATDASPEAGPPLDAPETPAEPSQPEAPAANDSSATETAPATDATPAEASSTTESQPASTDPAPETTAAAGPESAKAPSPSDGGSESSEGN